MSMVRDIELSLIDISEDRARSFSIEYAEGIAKTVLKLGLFHPIRVLPQGDRFTLISGRHRLEAFRINGAETIPATVSGAASPEAARMEEVMENLARGELIALDRCHHLYDMKQAWERLYPLAKRGGDRKSIKVRNLHFDPDAPEVFGFAEAVAEKIGLSRRTIFAAVKIWTEIVPSVRSRLPGTDLARKMTELKALSELTAPRQVKVIDLIQSEDHPEIQNIAEAVEFLDGARMTPAEKTIGKMISGFRALNDIAFDAVITAHEERVIASLKRRGRI